MDELMGNAKKGLQNFGILPQEAVAQAAAPALGAAAAPAAAAAGGAAPGLLAAAGGPVGLVAGGVGALLNGLFGAAQRKKEAQVAQLQAQAEGAGKLGETQAGGLNALMNAYRGMQ